MSQKNIIKIADKRLLLPAKWVAFLVGCSPDQVRKIRRGERSNETAIGERIDLVDELLPEKLNPIIQQVHELVKFEDTKKAG